jgi:hypothetical protein
MNIQEDMEAKATMMLKKYFIRRNMYVFLAKTYELYININKENLVFVY